LFMNNNIYLLIKIVLKKYNNGVFERWTIKDSKLLSDILFEETRVLLSYKTIDRIINSYYTNKRLNPQISTLNTFAKYVGYESWKNFVSSVNLEKSKYSKAWSFIFIIISVLIISIAFILFIKKKSYINEIDDNKKNFPFNQVIRIKSSINKTDTLTILNKD